MWIDSSVNEFSVDLKPGELQGSPNVERRWRNPAAKPSVHDLVGKVQRLPGDIKQ